MSMGSPALTGRDVLSPPVLLWEQLEREELKLRGCKFVFTWSLVSPGAGSWSPGSKAPRLGHKLTSAKGQALEKAAGGQSPSFLTKWQT